MSTLIIGIFAFACVLLICITWFLDRQEQRRHAWRMEYLGLPYPGDELDDELGLDELSASTDPREPQQS